MPSPEVPMRSAILALSLVLAAPPSRAAELPPQAVKLLTERFQKADLDHDGKLTREEAKAGMPRVFKNFDKIDADRKGFVTLQQILETLGKGR